MNNDLATTRAVQVICSQRALGAESWTIGSGYLIGGRWVLTAAHTLNYEQVFTTYSETLIRLPSGAMEHTTRAVAVGTPDLDLALLEITDELFDERLKPVQWARIDQSRPETINGCWAVGFPRFKETRRYSRGEVLQRDSQEIRGEIYPGSNLASGLLNMLVTITPRPLPDGDVTDSEWQGMSGALVFAPGYAADSVAVGVVTEHHRPEGPSSLLLTPLNRLPELSRGRAGAAARNAVTFLGAQNVESWLVLPRKATLSDISNTYAYSQQDVISHNPVPVALTGIPPSLIISTFVNRHRELENIASHLDPSKLATTPAALIASGPAGVGKTTLVAQAANRADDQGWFPGGVYFLDLHGYDPARGTDTSGAIVAILRALGTSPQHIPSAEDQQLRLYILEMKRLSKAGKPTLLVIDNVSDRQQFVALMPPPPHKLLGTSRHTQAGVEGASLLDLHVLSRAAARQLVSVAVGTARIGDRRVVSDLMSLDSLVTLCGYLPLALRISAAILAQEPNLPVATLVDDLSNERERLNRLAYEDLAVRASLARSHERLEPISKKVFALLALHPGRHLSIDSIAALTNLPTQRAISVVGELRRANLVQQGARYGWTRLHDLVRLYAFELCQQNQSEEDRNAATGRLIRYYDDTCASAEALLSFLNQDIEQRRLFTSRSEALSWMDSERTSIVAVVELAHSTGHQESAVSISLNCATFFRTRFRGSDWVKTAEIANSAALAMEPRQQGLTAANLGGALWAERRFGDSIIAYERASILLETANDVTDLISALIGLGVALWGLGHFDDSATHLMRAVTLSREVSYNQGEARALAALGNTLAELGHADKAVIQQRRSAEMFATLGDLHQWGLVLVNLACSKWRTGDGLGAVDNLETALDPLRDNDDIFGYALATTSLANALAGQGRLDEAITIHERAHRLFENLGDQYGVGRSLANMATVMKMAGRPIDAKRLELKAEEILREYEHQHGHTVAVI
jgi:tetratricopeptide (TPR) repeat protein